MNQKKAGLWQYMTTNWFSLRIPDNEKAERKTVHPFWRAVQECQQEYCSAYDIKRVFKSDKTASPEWYLSHIDGCLSSFAAILGITNRDEAINELKKHLSLRNKGKDFKTASIKKAIQQKTLTKICGGEY